MRTKDNFIAGALSCFAVILCLYNPPRALCQSPQETTSLPSTQDSSSNCGVITRNLGLTDNLTEVSDLRDSMTSEIARLDQKIKELSPQIPKAPSQQQLDNRRQEREKIAAKPTKTNDDLLRLAELDDTEIRSKESLEQELKIAERELNLKKKQARCIQQAINSFYSPEQTFKRTMSMIFAGLIGLVILGFFVLSFKDEKIRQAIFSGQTGIQFLTLFSIVIAIILFGITSILQDKELAALLGGLSGYILGRYSDTNESSPAKSGATAQAKNVPVINNT